MLHPMQHHRPGPAGDVDDPLHPQEIRSLERGQRLEPAAQGLPFDRRVPRQRERRNAVRLRQMCCGIGRIGGAVMRVTAKPGRRRQVAELPGETLPARIVLTRRAPAIPAPIAVALHDLAKAGAAEDSAAFAHAHVVGGVEADRSQVTKRPDTMTFPGSPDGITAVLDQPPALVFADTGDSLGVVRIPKSVSKDDSPSAWRRCS